MLDALLGSEIRYAFLRLFVFNPDRVYTLAEVGKKTRIRPQTLRAELRRLAPLGLLVQQEENGVRTFRMNPNAQLFPELRALFLKAQILTEYDFGKKIQTIGRVRLAILTGFFTNVPEARTDIFIVGTVNRLKLRRMVRRFQREMDHDLRYTVLTQKEYQYRKDITDRFLYDILENRKIVLVDKYKK
ncbi:MAG: hypothetical protein AAB515_03845 [Patescibacteria group bacterium]